MTDPECALAAEALFASDLQPSDQPTHAQIQDTVTATTLRLGVGECANRLATEHGEHPSLAAARMSWCLNTVTAAFRRVPV